MISSLYGTVYSIIESEYTCHIRTDTIEYELLCSLHSLKHLYSRRNAKAWVYTYFLLSDKAAQLFGFAEREEKECFTALIKVSGIGPRVALKILSKTHWSTLIQYASSREEAALARTPGIGEKKAPLVVAQFSKKARPRVDKAILNTNVSHNTTNAHKKFNEYIQEVYASMKERGYKDPELTVALLEAEKEVEKYPERDPEKVPEKVPEKMPEKVPEKLPEKMPEKELKKEPEKKTETSREKQHYQERILVYVLEKLS